MFVNFVHRLLSLLLVQIAVASFAAPMIRASNKSGLGPIVVGEGEHTYEVEHDWGRLPPELAYGNTHGVCEDSAGNIYIKHTVHSSSQSGDAIVVFDADDSHSKRVGS